MSDRSFTVIRDTREKKPYNLEDPRILDVVTKKLDTGDYSIEGLEKMFAIERKASVNELHVNLSKHKIGAFKRELERFQSYRFKYMILDATYQQLLDFPRNNGLHFTVVDKIKVRGTFLSACLIRLQVKYNFNIIFAGNKENSERIAINIMKEVLETLDGEISNQ